MIFLSQSSRDIASSGVVARGAGTRPRPLVPRQRVVSLI